MGGGYALLLAARWGDDASSVNCGNVRVGLPLYTRNGRNFEALDDLLTVVVV